MPIAFLNAGGKAAVEIWKFGLYLWCEEQLRGNLVLILNNDGAAPANFEELRIIFPCVFEENSIQDHSDWLGREDYPLNNFKFGPYEKGSVTNLVQRYDGIPKVRILSSTSINVQRPASVGPEWSVVQLDYSSSPLRPGETGGLLLTFELPMSRTQGTSVAPHGLTYSKTDISLHFSIRIFDRYLMVSAAGAPPIRDAEIIKAKVLYDKAARHGGFDTNLFVPTSYIDAKTSPEAEYLDVVAYNFNGQASADKFTRFVWRARRLYEDRDSVQCGDRMVLSGVFLNPNEVLSQLRAVSRDLAGEISEVKTVSEKLQKVMDQVEKVDWWGKVAILIAVVGLLALVLEYQRIVEIFNDFLGLIS